MAFAYIGYRIEWKMDPVSNRTLLFVTGYDDKKLNPLNRLAFLLYGAVYLLFSWITVTVCTALLIVKLRQVAKWRAKVANDMNGAWRDRDFSPPSHSDRSIRATKTVITLVGIFIITSLPGSVSLVVSIISREFSVDGTLMYPFRITFSFCVLLSEINSSLNVFVFAAIGAKFRFGLYKLLCIK